MGEILFSSKNYEQIICENGKIFKIKSNKIDNSNLHSESIVIKHKARMNTATNPIIKTVAHQGGIASPETPNQPI